MVLISLHYLALFRQKSQTRQDIQVLGLALEVRSIEQQLSEMNKSIEDAQKLINRPVKSIRSLVETSISKQASHCMGLAGKVSQLAKQIVSVDRTSQLYFSLKLVLLFWLEMTLESKLLWKLNSSF